MKIAGSAPVRKVSDVEDKKADPADEPNQMRTTPWTM
jgi:hypothetical protein